MAPKFALFTKGSKLPLNQGFQNTFLVTTVYTPSPRYKTYSYRAVLQEICINCLIDIKLFQSSYYVKMESPYFEHGSIFCDKFGAERIQDHSKPNFFL